nr:AAA family ATPase [Pseudohoeflea sp. DP4N28-3]
MTALSEDDVDAHRQTAQALITRFVLLTAEGGGRSTPLAGTGRRFVSTVATGGMRRTREIEFAKTVAALTPDDPLLSPARHTLVYRVRRGVAVALAVADQFARQSHLEDLQARNRSQPLQGDDAARFHALLSASSYVAAFSFAAYLLQTVDGESEPLNADEEPDLAFDTPQDALKALLAGLDATIDGAGDDAVMVARTRAFAREAIDALLVRRGRFAALASFAQAHIRLESDDFTLDGFEVAPGQRRRPLVMDFKKPEEIIGNHLAKHQAMRLARMIVAYDFERQLNPFVELGGFVFTFIGDGAPGTGKTILIQMMAGLINDYCQMAGYPFHYENFGVDQISSYQGKSGQNCKAFIDNVVNPRAIGFGTIDDIDQVAAKRSDDRASAGQQEVTAVLMEAFAGAGTVVRGNCLFGMFSNYPENVDDALRQRAGARWLIDGPQSEADYIDIFALLAGDNHAIPLGDHALFEGQQIRQAVRRAFADHDRPDEARLQAVWERFTATHGPARTLRDLGIYLHMIKQAEPRFTGRAIKNITDAIKMRTMDIDLPDAWFETPDAFLRKSYDDKLAMISELRTPFTLEMVMQEIHRYADSEFRYSDRADSAAVEEIVRRERQRQQAAAKIEAMKRDGRWQ